MLSARLPITLSSSYRLQVRVENESISEGLPVVVDRFSLAMLLGVTPREIGMVMHTAPETTPDGRRIWAYQKNNYYTVFEIPKPQTRWEEEQGIQRVRHIQSPHQPLKKIQRALADKFWSEFPIPPEATAYREGLCIADTALQHAGTQLVICIDLKDFFTSFKEKMIRLFLMERGYPYLVSRTISELCCYRNFLPQGSPCSPVVSNVIAGALIDGKIKQMATRRGFHYSRYADDMIFSARRSGAQSMDNADGVVQDVKRIVEAVGFQIAPKKTKYMRPHKRQTVLGMIVNKAPDHDPSFEGEPFVRISMDMYKRLRAMLHDAATRSITEAATRHGKSPTQFMRYIQGYLGSFMKQCDKRRYYNLIHQWNYIKEKWTHEQAAEERSFEATLPTLL